MTVPADVAYSRTRAELIHYEDSAFAALLSGVPDCYRKGHDNTTWGWLLRSVAQHLGARDYRDQMDLFGLDPAKLDPAELVRRYHDVIPLGRSFPGLTQFDEDYKEMVLALLDAFKSGARIEAIPAVITALTGATPDMFSVTEMYEQIGHNGVDCSYRNTIRVEVPVVTGAASGAFSSSRTILQDISNALSKVKAAHIGVELIGRIPTSESFVDTIREIRDSWTIIMPLTDGPEVKPHLRLAPYVKTKTPRTVLSPAHTLSLTYQWFKNGVAIPGATSPSLAVKAVLSDMGADGATPSTYFVEATDPKLGRVWSKTIPLLVTAKPSSGWGTPGSGTVAAPLPMALPAAPAPFDPTGDLVVTQQPMSRSVYEDENVTLAVVVGSDLVQGTLAPHRNRPWAIRGDQAKVSIDGGLDFVDPGFVDDGMFQPDVNLNPRLLNEDGVRLTTEAGDRLTLEGM